MSRRLVAAGVLLGLTPALLLGLLWSLAGVTSFEEVRSAYVPSEALLLDRRGAILHELRVDDSIRRLPWTEIEEISPAFQQAVIEAEDHRFREHSGVDWRALAAATHQWVTGGGVRGASTLSMQVAGVLTEASGPGGGRRSVLDKLRQMAAASRLELRWTKPQILEAYCNLVSFRGELQGIAAASRGLFGKDPHALTSAEGAVLAALLRAPNASAEEVLNRAARLTLRLHPAPEPTELRTAAERLEVGYRIHRREDWAPHVARRLLAVRGNTAGFVRSSLDRDVQVFVAETVRRHLLPLASHNVRDAAALVVDHSNGQVLAYVGNGGELSSARHVDGVRAARQAGSTLKPFLYGLAFERRLLTPASLIDDRPLDLSVAGGIYQPGNYDHRYRGAVSCRTALASSLNVPAVRVVDLVGVDSLVDRLAELGFRSLRSADYYGPSLALGSADITLWDLAAAYAALARGGSIVALSLEASETGTAGRSVFSPEAAFLVSDILADREARSRTFSLESPLASRYWTAVKTGTSKDMRDNWCVGYSSRFTVAVWVGNFSGESMWDVSGISGAAPIWLEIMDRLHAGEPSTAPQPPPGLVRAAVAEAPSEPAREEWFVAGTEPRVVRPVGDRAVSRIVYPADGTIIALDPDIPEALQRVFFQASALAAGGVWELNGRRLGDRALIPWAPRAGRHTLSLLDASGRSLDTVRFAVRGPGGSNE
jgi:penicillin-binding protein 1C